jgi:ribosomal protein S18 acetylase RimI-like enzyme
MSKKTSKKTNHTDQSAGQSPVNRIEQDISRKRAVAYLKKDLPAHIHMLEALRHRDINIIYAEDDGVILIDKKSNSCQISLENASNLNVDLLPEVKLFCVSGTACAKIVRNTQKFSRELVTNQVCYLRSEKPGGDFSAVRRLGEKDQDIAAKAYASGPDYIKERIQSGAVYGFYERGNLAGFIGRHDEGSIGLLEVLPAYRRRGIGETLLSFLANLYLEEGKIPYSQIELGNDASFALHEKLGFIRSGALLYWID